MPLVAPDAFPRIRLNRGAGANPDDLGPVSAPRTRFFNFLDFMAANSRSSQSFPQVQGPGLIKDIWFSQQTWTDPPPMTIEIGLAHTPVREVAVANGLPRPFQCLFELRDPWAVMPDAVGDGIITSTWAAHPRPLFPLDLIIPPGAWYIVLSTSNTSIGFTTRLLGHLRVIEGVDPEALRFFL
jgi:hypothetical protein